MISCCSVVVVDMASSSSSSSSASIHRGQKKRLRDSSWHSPPSRIYYLIGTLFKGIFIAGILHNLEIKNMHTFRIMDSRIIILLYSCLGFYSIYERRSERSCRCTFRYVFFFSVTTTSYCFSLISLLRIITMLCLCVTYSVWSGNESESYRFWVFFFGVTKAHRESASSQNHQFIRMYSFIENAFFLLHHEKHQNSVGWTVGSIHHFSPLIFLHSPRWGILIIVSLMKRPVMWFAYWPLNNRASFRLFIKQLIATLSTINQFSMHVDTDARSACQEC